jgi:hypothetical protein
MVDEGDADALADSVNEAKSAQGVPPGGAFLLDEFGRVLVPVTGRNGAGVYIAGECSGPFRFRSPFSRRTVIDLYDDGGLNTGDAWHRPYVGIQYQLSKQGELYFWKEDRRGARKLLPPAQDEKLIAQLRTLRPHGPVRFLMGPGGVVFTKVPPSWEVRYVGRIDFATWFRKEDLA